MTKLKIDSKLNKDVEKCVKDIAKLSYGKDVLYKATRRYNDRLYAKKHEKKLADSKNKKCQKKKKSKK